jgi:chaperonin GroES
MKIRPLDDRILVQPLSPETVTPGGLVIPEKAQEKQARGIVVSVGPGKRQDDGTRLPVDVEPGQTVVYTKYSGSEVELHSEKFVILRADEIVGVLED